jgi:hypothetical protein
LVFWLLERRPRPDWDVATPGGKISFRKAPTKGNIPSNSLQGQNIFIESQARKASRIAKV